MVSRRWAANIDHYSSSGWLKSREKEWGFSITVTFFYALCVNDRCFQIIPIAFVKYSADGFAGEQKWNIRKNLLTYDKDLMVCSIH